MIALDTNVIMAALISSTLNHEKAIHTLEQLNDSFCTTPTNIGETLRLLTHPKVFEKPLRLPKAVAHFSSFLEGYSILTLDEPTDWWRGLINIEKEIPGLKGNEIFDARIALCLRAHGVKKIFTWDADFKKYSFLTTIKSI
jgi:uncharacterized protein